jgi:RNA polymerase sigma-B factor
MQQVSVTDEISPNPRAMSPIEGASSREPSTSEPAKPAHHNVSPRHQSREELIMHHQKLVQYVAARFLGSGETLEDLIQVGNIGLINALDRYDASKDVKFSTYAMPTIVGEIKRHFRDKTWQVKVPRWLQELSINARKAQQSLSLKLGRSPTVREIAEAVGASEDRTLEALEITHVANTISLDTRLDAGAGSDSATLMDVIGRSDRGLFDIDAYSDLRRAIGLLDPRERQVIELRFFDDLSQAKIARQMCISQMHVSRLQQRALIRLKSILADEAVGPKRRRKVIARPSASSPTPN